MKIIESGVTRALVDGAYNQRRWECDSALAAMGITSWRDATIADVSAANLSAAEHRRARHVVSEIARVEQAALAMEQGDIARFGELLAASHASLRDDFQTSHPQVDALVTRIQELLHGEGSARITGAGFGGAVVAVTSKERAGVLDQLGREIISV